MAGAAKERQQALGRLRSERSAPHGARARFVAGLLRSSGYRERDSNPQGLTAGGF